MDFEYSAYNKNGRRLRGVAQADSIPALISQLKMQDLVPLHVVEVSSSVPRLAAGGIIKLHNIKGRDVAVFTRQLATILNSGIPITDALATISEDMENKYFREVVRKLTSDISGGKSFSQALSQRLDIFPEAFIAVARSGEEIGNLGKILGNLAQYLEDFERIKQKLKTATRYPLFLFSFFVLVVSAIVVFLIPKFKVMFMQAKVQLPLMTRIVVGISEFCLKNFIPVLSAAFLFLILLLVLLRIRAVKLRWSAFILKIPMIGVLIHKAIVARFCHTFSILLYGGAGVIMSLSVASGVAGNIFVMQIIEQIRTQVVGGISLGEAMKSQSFFPRMVTRMISVGEKTGKLDEMFKRSAEYYEEELEATLANFASLIEPVFIVMLGSVVLIVVLALYLPIFKISMAVK